MNLGWQALAACKDREHLFFGPDDEPWPDCLERVAYAQAVCARCPVSGPCGDLASTLRVRYGVWAGKDLERAPAFPEGPPVLCGKGLHLMTPDNAKPVAGTGQWRCRACLRDGDRRTRPARHARMRRRREERDGVAA